MKPPDPRPDSALGVPPFVCLRCLTAHNDPITHVCPPPIVGQQWRVDGVVDTVRAVAELAPDAAWEVVWDRGSPVRYVRIGVVARDAVIWPPHRAQRVTP